MGLITGALLSGGRLYPGTHDLMYFFCLQEVGLITGGLLSVWGVWGGLISRGLIIKSIFCLPEDRLITGGLLSG